MAKSPPSPFPGTQCCFPLTNYLSSPLQTHSFAQFCTNARLQVQPVQRACNALRKWQTFRFEAVFCIYNHSHPVFHPCMLYVFLKLLHFPWCQAMITPRYLMTLWWSKIHQSRWKHCYLCTCTAHIARHHSSNIDGNIVVVLWKYCCQCSNIGQISLWKDAQLLRDITRPILTKGFLSQTTGFRSMTKRLRKCWSFTLRTKAQGNDCGSDGKLNREGFKNPPKLWFTTMTIDHLHVR